MPKIKSENISKRYGFRWVLRDLNFELDTESIIGITGRNGSGKSTLMKILSGFLSPSQGKISHYINDDKLKPVNLYQFISLTAPYTDLVNEFTLREMLKFHQRFKPFYSTVNYDNFSEIIELKVPETMVLGEFSSGMKQKIQLALSIMSNTPFLLLDEPTSFLDSEARKWFNQLIEKYKRDRLVVIASNDDFDLNICSRFIHLESK